MAGNAGALGGAAAQAGLGAVPRISQMTPSTTAPQGPLQAGNPVAVPAPGSTPAGGGKTGGTTGIPNLTPQEIEKMRVMTTTGSGSIPSATPAVYQPPSQPNMNQMAAQGIRNAMGGTMREMAYTPQQVASRDVTGEGYTAERAGSQGYGAERIAGVGPITEQSVRAGQLATTGLDPYMNPYESAVVQQSLSDLERSRLMQQNQLGAQASAAGAFGGSRQGIAESETNRAFAEQAARTAAGLRQAGFTQAQAAAQQDIQSAMQAALANQAANLQAQTTTGQFGLQSQLANQAAANQAAQFGAQAANVAALQNAQMGNQALQFSAQARNAAQLANQQAALNAALANQSAGLAGSQQRLGAAGQLANIGNLGFGMSQTVQQNLAQQGALQQALQQQVIDAARGQYTGYTGYPATSLGYMASALGASPQPMSQTTSKQPGLFDYLTLAATAGPKLATMSDIRLKKEIKRIGTFRNGLPMYEWKWNEKAKQLGAENDPTIGVIAQEAQKVVPHAVIEGADGYLRVNYKEII